MQTQNITGDQFVIGRATTCHLVLQDEQISREHIRIERAPDGRFRITDLGSRNKSFVNGQMISETILSPGDIIRAGGNCVMEFLDDTMLDGRVGLDFLTPDRTEPPDCDWVKIKVPVSLTVAQLEQLTNLFGQPGMTARPEDVANTALGQLLIDLRADRGLVALRGEARAELHPIAHRGLRRPNGGSLTPVSQAFVFASLLQSVAGRYPQSAAELEAKLGYAAAAVVAPLTHRGEVIGVLYADRPTTKRPFGPEAVAYMCAAGAQLGAMMAESSRRMVQLAQREGAAWLSTLRRMQAVMSSPLTSTEALSVASRFISGTLRCGDIVDAGMCGDTRGWLLVVDGGGHGLSGLAQAAAIRLAVRCAVEATEDNLTDPAPMFAAMNRAMAAAAKRQVVPCTFVGFDLSLGRLTYINAGGMPPLLMIAPGRLVTLDQPSLVLGVDPQFEYKAARVDLPGAFRLVCHSDGLTDAAGGGGEPYGSARLHELLLDQAAFAPAEVVLDRVVKAVTGHLSGAAPTDDISILVAARG